MIQRPRIRRIGKCLSEIKNHSFQLSDTFIHTHVTFTISHSAGEGNKEHNNDNVCVCVCIQYKYCMKATLHRTGTGGVECPGVHEKG